MVTFWVPKPWEENQTEEDTKRQVIIQDLPQERMRQKMGFLRSPFFFPVSFLHLSRTLTLSY